nr:S41 family peptidase [Sphingobium sp. AP50]
MQNAYRGKIAVLIDERTYSDGETFAAAIKSLALRRWSTRARLAQASGCPIATG